MTRKQLEKQVPDLLAGVGLAVLSVGLWWYSPALSLIVVGALVAAAGILLGRHK